MIELNLRYLIVPFSLSLQSFLGFGSQYLFHKIDPGPLSTTQATILDIFMFSIFTSYLRACFVNPGWVPKDWKPSQPDNPDPTLRWCRKCDAPKPARAHHCKQCKRCIPKMDHHCPWTLSCVSYRTFPHFLRFLLYSVTAMLFVEYSLYIRAAALWSQRHESSVMFPGEACSICALMQSLQHLGPSTSQLILFFLLIVANSMTLFGMGLLLLRNIWTLVLNQTTIEGWEMERHEVLVRRAKRRGGYLDGPGGVRIRMTRQEFPFDVGIWSNIRQGLTGSPLLWFMPFAPTPPNDQGLAFPTNGFDDRPWPPPDPDRVPRTDHIMSSSSGFEAGQDQMAAAEQKAAFLKRQQKDLQRFQSDRGIESEDKTAGAGFKNSEGETLDDFGVDEHVEFQDDDVPLSELLHRRRKRL